MTASIEDALAPDDCIAAEGETSPECPFSSEAAARRVPDCLDEDWRRIGCCTGPMPVAGVVVLRRTTRFRGAGLLSRLRRLGGDVGREADEGAPPDAWTLAARTCLRVWRTPGRSGCACSWLLLLSAAASRPDEDDVDRLSALRLRVAITGAMPFAAAAAAAAASDAEAPSLKSALVRALSFIGMGISSSELSWRVEYCCCCASAAPLGAPAAEPRLAAVPDAAPFSRDRDGGRRRACLAEVRRPRDVTTLPWPRGVGDAAAIVRRDCWSRAGGC